MNEKPEPTAEDLEFVNGWAYVPDLLGRPMIERDKNDSTIVRMHGDIRHTGGCH